MQCMFKTLNPIAAHTVYTFKQCLSGIHLWTTSRLYCDIVTFLHTKHQQFSCFLEGKDWKLFLRTKSWMGAPPPLVNCSTFSLLVLLISIFVFVSWEGSGNPPWVCPKSLSSYFPKEWAFWTILFAEYPFHCNELEVEAK